MEENGLERAIHPPYSPHLAPSDFYLFIPVTHCLRGQSFETADELFLAIDAVLRGIRQYIGCRDFGNVFKSMVTISKKLNKLQWAESVLRGTCRDVRDLLLQFSGHVSRYRLNIEHPVCNGTRSHLSHIAAKDRVNSINDARVPGGVSIVNARAVYYPSSWRYC
jgi:hypothetical protein